MRRRADPLTVVGFLGLFLALLLYVSQAMRAALYVPLCQGPEGWSYEGRCLWVQLGVWFALGLGAVSLALLGTGLARRLRRAG
ncbi:hypothetical protein P2318_06890 [Myxococcaceae bacterium GXIMD 01537]